MAWCEANALPAAVETLSSQTFLRSRKDLDLEPSPAPVTRCQERRNEGTGFEFTSLSRAVRPGRSGPNLWGGREGHGKGNGVRDSLRTRVWGRFRRGAETPSDTRKWAGGAPRARPPANALGWRLRREGGLSGRESTRVRLAGAPTSAGVECGATPRQPGSRSPRGASADDGGGPRLASALERGAGGTRPFPGRRAAPAPGLRTGREGPTAPSERRAAPRPGATGKGAGGGRRGLQRRASLDAELNPSPARPGSGRAAEERAPGRPGPPRPHGPFGEGAGERASRGRGEQGRGGAWRGSRGERAGQRPRGGAER